mmetsp:Transcript_11186/g.50718  ORF Transcript_11186/g.50718 Transcript_11186/m.50718 type:complete len:107 (+) Transcript_11186:2558-2878(+)
MMPPPPYGMMPGMPGMMPGMPGMMPGMVPGMMPPPGVTPAPQPPAVAPRPEQAPITATVMVWDDESESIEERRASLSKYSGVEKAAAEGGETKDPTNSADGEEDAR